MTFDVAFDRLFDAEGGYVNDPRDPGGETNWGISKRSYPDVDIKALTRDGAKAIYLRDFWSRLPSLPDAVTFQLFDFAVNSGVDTAIRHLQRAIGVIADGRWGANSTLAANHRDAGALVLLLNAERLDYMAALSNWSDAGRGWARRTATNLRYALQDQ
jgi:lysozyme family protein